MRFNRSILLGLTLMGLTAAPTMAEGKRQRGPDQMNQLAEFDDPTVEMRKEITSLNLINALNLTPEQLTQILKLADRQDVILKEHSARMAQVSRELQPALSELKGVLEQQKEISDNLANRVNRIDHQNMKMRDQLMGDLARTGQEIEGILTEAQLEVIETFQPCIIPPRDLSDPVRAGQASNSGIGEDLLRKIRGMSDQEFRMQAPRIVDQGLNRAAEFHGKLTEKERAGERERLLALVNEVRGMSDVEFEMKKDELTKQLKPKNKIKELQHKMEEARIGGSVGKAARFLMNPAAIKVLRNRAKQMDVAIK
ncbi:MAG: hypothetical protein AB1696_08265 [Planctomycetota bacterium]